MQLTSFTYLCFVIVSLILYYLMPRKHRWIILLLSGMVFALSYGDRWLIIYPVAASFVTYLSAILMPRNRKLWFAVGIIGDLGMLIALKYLNFPIYTINGIGRLVNGGTDIFKPLSFLVPLGISFYTLSLMDYLRNVYFEAEEAEHNYFKMLLFTTYFPCIVSGPINRYSKFVPQITEGAVFEYDRLAFGAQRILWGFFKVLVISNRLEVLVSTIYSDTSVYNGTYVVVAALAFTMQLYTNFSGSIDIIMGTSVCFGIELEENFRQPFFAKSVQEFWRRWHITLGTWAKDFVFYPVLRSGAFVTLSSRLKDRYDKKKAKRITNMLAMFILWFTVGLWHGGAWKYIIGSGLLHWLFITCEEALEGKKKKPSTADGSGAGSPKANTLKDVLRMIRTYLLVSASFVFFASADLTSGIKAYRDMFGAFNPEILWNGSLLSLGLELKDILILAASLILLLAVSMINEKNDVFKTVASLKLVPRWCIYLIVLFAVLLLGSYGPGYSATEFIYQGF